MREYRIAVMPGDGIGKEVIPAGVTVLERMQERDKKFRMKFESFPWGSDYYRKTGKMLPDDALTTLKPFDAIFFGAVGDPDIPDHITLWGLRLKICQGFDQYANVRPTRVLPGVTSPLRGINPGDFDWVIVRENSEGEYAGQGGRSHIGLPEEVATETAIFTRTGVDPHHALCPRAGALAPAQNADGGNQEQCTAPWHGAVGPDRRRGEPRLSRT